MPYAEVSITKNLITEEEKSILAKKLTKILLDTEALIDNPISRSIALLDIKKFDSLYVGGEQGNYDRALVKIHLFSDAIDEEIKKKLFSDITNAFISISDKVKSQNGRNLWCMIVPLHNCEFASGGIPVNLERTRELVSSYKE